MEILMEIPLQKGGGILENATLGSQLRKYREINKYTQKEVAKYLNIQRQTYSNYERNIRTPDPKTLAALASLYKVSVDDLLCTNTLKDASHSGFYHEGIVPPSNSQIHLTGTEAKLVMDYRSLPEELKQNQLRYMRFLKSEAADIG